MKVGKIVPTNREMILNNLLIIKLADNSLSVIKLSA
jgi:hypothetical protein